MLTPVNPTGCPRCTTERRAQWVRVATNVLVCVTLAVVGVSGCTLGVCARGGLTPPALVNAEAFALGGLSLSRHAVGVVVALFALFCYLTRRAAAPLSPPAPDPLATYRGSARVECPRHPFAG
ncbi:MAG: hypothetical protein JWM10_234 [Myxococcaceae bacterium]|nr:hypothetical protein [Myxococcaceae bacterium]